MNEANRLQRMRELGVRLQELRLLPSHSVNSYAGAALNFLFQHHQIKKPAGAPLDDSLRALAVGLALKHKMLTRPDPDKVIDFFCRHYQVH
ncbi:hypothetical protein EMM73_02610 [Rheinheimera sediminis]|uniref:hypothetical protein n=1 Tax=Rheinheimera sp. YQF-1 TaxID=2499626 RepID=UPI000FD78195|nr:hypothetical protein [Rheinheimera sp. YQF-1]RVT48203.1 hypothetical protein EMM73_02610 [Rheinheimera sp. YQF-1]